MAYIPKDDENAQSGMNVLAPQQGTQNNNQNSQNNASQNASGGQSATIGGTAGQGSQNASQAQNKAPKAKAKSGMFTNLKKYINQNKDGANRMSSKLQQNATQENANISQAINKQQNDFMSRVNANRGRMDQAQQFGQDTINSASNQNNQQYMQQQQTDLQQRQDAIGPIDNQIVQSYNQQGAGQGFDQYANQQLGLDQQQQAYAQSQQQYQQELDRYNQAVGNVFGGEGQQQVTTRFDPLKGTGNYQTFTNEQITQNLQNQNRYNADGTANVDFMKAPTNNTSALSSGTFDNQYQPNQQILSNMQQSIEQQLNNNDPFSPGIAEDQRVALSKKLEDLKFIQARQQGNEQGFESDNQVIDERRRLNDLNTQYQSAQEQQRLYQNKQQLQNEMDVIQDKITNSPQELTESDIQRFNNLRTGVERFDDAILNLSSEKRQVEDFAQSAEAFNSNQGRRDAMRQTFGGTGNYTSGQASLDNLILTGNKQAVNDLIQNTQQQAQQAQETLSQAFQQGQISRDEMIRETNNLQEKLNTDLAAAQQGLQDDLTQRVQTGEGTYIQELRGRLESGQGLTQQDMDLIGLTGNEIYNENIDPATLLTDYDPTQYSVQDVANLNDVARAQSLARLSGKDQQDMLLNQEDISRRNLAGEGENTLQRSELASQDLAAVKGLQDQLKSREDISASEGQTKIIQDMINDYKYNAGSENSGPNKYNKDIINELNQMLKSGQYSDPYGRGEVSADDLLNSETLRKRQDSENNVEQDIAAQALGGNLYNSDGKDITKDQVLRDMYNRLLEENKRVSNVGSRLSQESASRVDLGQAAKRKVGNE